MENEYNFILKYTFVLNSNRSFLYLALFFYQQKTLATNCLENKVFLCRPVRGCRYHTKYQLL